MKTLTKINLKLIYFFLVVLFLVSCQEKKTTKQETPEVTNIVDPPKQIISNAEAKELFDDYSKEVVPLLENEENTKHTTRFVEYDYKTLKNYIAYIEQEAKQAEDTEIKSLRFYFGKYPNKKKKKRNTMFMVPTTQFKGVDYNQGFYIAIDSKGNKTATAINNKVNSTGTKVGTTKNSTQKNYASVLPTTNNYLPPSSKSLTMNKGGSGPPPSGDFDD